MSRFIQQQKTLKNLKTIQIREAKLEDAPALLACVSQYIKDSEYIPKLDEEIVTSLAHEKTWIQTFLDSTNSILLVAEYNNEIIGNVDLTGSKRKLMQHTAVLGMGMLKEWRNTGLGTALLGSAIDWSLKNPILEMLWLQVYTENTAGLQLYRKLGFEDSGLMKGFFKHGSVYYDQLTMTRSVKEFQ